MSSVNKRKEAVTSEEALPGKKKLSRQARYNKKRKEQILSRIPAGRWGEPQDLAGAIIFLASPASDYVNGHVLVVDGGWLAY